MIYLRFTQTPIGLLLSKHDKINFNEDREIKKTLFSKHLFLLFSRYIYLLDLGHSVVNSISVVCVKLQLG